MFQRAYCTIRLFERFGDMLLEKQFYFRFVEREHEQKFIKKDIFSIYEILQTNFDEWVPVISENCLHEHQTYNDLLPIIIENYEISYHKRFRFEHDEDGHVTDASYEDYFHIMDIEHADMLFDLYEDIKHGFLYHDLFFMEIAPFQNEKSHKRIIHNKPIQKVW